MINDLFLLERFKWHSLKKYVMREKNCSFTFFQFYSTLIKNKKCTIINVIFIRNYKSIILTILIVLLLNSPNNSKIHRETLNTCH